MNSYRYVITVVSILASRASAHAGAPLHFLFASNPPMAIPDNVPGGFGFAINVPNHGPIKDLNIGMNVAHTWQGDIIATLIHTETAHVATLVSRPGVTTPGTFGFNVDNFGSSVTGAEMVFDDEATQGPYDLPAVAFPGIANVFGAWKPESCLDVFDGEDLFGVWVLRLSDNAASDVGTFSRMHLVIDVGPLCRPDITDNGAVNIDDLLAVINAWGACPVPACACAADIAPPGGNGQVDIDDMLAVINGWGACP